MPGDYDTLAAVYDWIVPEAMVTPEGIAAELRPGGVLVLTSRNWELVRAQGGGVHVFDHVVVRDGRRGVVIYSWWLADAWDDRHEFDVAVALIDDDGAVTTHAERL